MSMHHAYVLVELLKKYIRIIILLIDSRDSGSVFLLMQFGLDKAYGPLSLRQKDYPISEQTQLQIDHNVFIASIVAVFNGSAECTS